MSVGLHGVVIAGEDISCLVDTVSLNHGRDDSESQPEAASATINLTATPDAPIPLAIDVGSAVVITTTTANGTFDRFRGEVTDITLSWEEAGENTPDAGVGQIIAVGHLADLGRRVVGDAPFPEELDGARVARVLQLAGVPVDPLLNDPGVADLLPRDVDARAALEVAHAAAASAMGVLWHTRSGEVRYADAQHRRGIPVSLTLDSCDLLVTPQWRRTTEGLTNEVSIGYGVAPEDAEGGGGEQPRYVASRADSIAKWGKFAYSSTTELADSAAAQRMGEILLARNAEPVWVMGSLPVDVATLDDDRYEQLLNLDMHSLITLTGLPSLGHAPTSASLWVEGYSETLAYGTHDMTLTVTGYCRTTPPTQWDDVNPGWMWGGGDKTDGRRNVFVNPALTVDATHWKVNQHPSYTGAAVGTRMPGGDGPPVGHDIAYYRSTWPVDATRSDGNGIGVGAPASDAIRCDGATTITGSFWVRSSTPAGVKRTVRPGMSFYGLSSDLIQPSVYGVATDIGNGKGWVRYTLSGPVPPGAKRVTFGMTMFDSPPETITAGETFDVTAVLVELDVPPEAGTYFDGDTPDTAESDYGWTGGRGSSVSLEKITKPLYILTETGRNLSVNPTAVAGPGWFPNDAHWAVTKGEPGNRTPDGIDTMARVNVADPVGAGQTSASLYDVDGMGGSPVSRAVGLWVWPSYDSEVEVYLADDKPGTVRVTPVPTGGWAYVTSAGAGTGYAVVNVRRVEVIDVPSHVTYVTGSIASADVPPVYWDGDTPDLPTVDYRWAGAPYLSESVPTG